MLAVFSFFLLVKKKRAVILTKKQTKRDAAMCRQRTFVNDEPKSGKNVKNVNKNARNVFDKMESYVILMLNRYIRKSTKILLEA